MKQLKFLTTTELIYRKLVEIASLVSYEQAIPSPIKVKGYKLITDLNNLSSGKSVLIGKFNDTKKNKPVFIKKYAFKTKGVRYASLINELAIAQVFSKCKLNAIPKFDLVIPKVTRASFNKNEITIISEFKSGKLLFQSSEKTKVSTLIKVLDAIKLINKKIKPSLNTLPKRSTTVLAIIFLYFWMKSILKHPQNFRQLVTFLITFYSNYFATIKETDIYGLVHRDLHSKNILLKNNKVIITDWEGAVLTDSLYDLAMIGRLYANELSAKSLLLIYSRYLTTNSEVRRFIYLTIFHIVQTIAVDTPSDKLYHNTAKYSDALFSTFIPSLLSKGTNLAKSI